VEFGVLVPQDRTSMRVRMELAAREKVTIRGAERELLRLNLRAKTSPGPFGWTIKISSSLCEFRLRTIILR